MLADLTRGVMIAAGSAAIICCAANAADTFPARPMRLIVPYAPGGNADILGRIIGQRLAEALGQPVVIDNRPGANSIIGTELVARSAPDGHTLLLIAVGHATNVSLMRKLPYDTLRDLAPITLSGATPIVLVVSVGFPADSIKSLIAYAQTRPGQIDFASSGNGSPAHMAGALLNMMAGITLNHVPYKGTAQATTDVIAGHIQSALPSLTSVLPHIRSGKLKALGITGAQRSPLAPDLPTIAEAGVPGYQANIWNGLLAAGATPKPLIARLNRELVRQLNLPETRERYAGLGAEVLTSTPEEFDAFIRAEITKWAQVIKAAGIQAN
ncbi:MAG: tripartite tricarboxylate transporter substrate binding protein [Betaproteobacteria bacterium]|nr:tripartite tricarboxylate transporter substrate binding protein [Betaproteobacteria bacterium]